MRRTKFVEKEDVRKNGDVLPEPSCRRIPFRLNKTTIILVREGLNAEEHARRYPQYNK